MLGVKKGSELINSIDGIEAAFKDKNRNIITTSGVDFIALK